MRIIAALGYLAVLGVLALYLNGTLLPPFGLDGLWFYSAFAAIILGEFVVEPYFTRPADSLANGAALVIASASASLAGTEINVNATRAGRVVFVVVGLVVIAMSIIAMTMKDYGGARGRIAADASFVVRRVGQARVLFSALLFASGYAAFADEGDKIAVLYLTWFTISVVAPIEILITSWMRVRTRRPIVGQAAVVERVEDPGIVIARLPSGARPTIGASATLADGRVGVVVDATTLVNEPRVRIAVSSGAPAALGSHVVLDPNVIAFSEPVIGFVGERTTLVDLRVRTSAAAAELGLAEGHLLQVAIGEKQVLFQITEATIAGEAIADGSRDVVDVTARKLGTWDSDSREFEGTPWLPSPGAEVKLVARAADAFVVDQVGHVPGTEFGVRVNLDLAVTHNTAVLGVLGVGKTHLAWELIQRMLSHGTKVVVLDITGEYSQYLADVCAPETEAAITDKLNADVAANLNNRTVRGPEEQAGNVVEFTTAVRTLLDEFLHGDERLLVLNPSRLEVSRMEGRPFSGNANMLVRLTIVEITHVVTDMLLSVMSGEFIDQARVCLVLEEAHSLVPEWNSTVNDAERSAVNGTARAILQGRKYGLGCLVVTQRTANVTKSILNQCNTIFALRTYDSTGMGFLQNYIGESHARLLAALPERHAVVFGRASSSNAPLIVKLNEADAFLAGFWEEARPEIPITSPPHEDHSESDDGPDPPPF